MSKLINKTRLQEFATGLWGKIKQRYDVAFKGVTLTDDKKLKFTKIEGADTVDVDLVAYARLQDRNEFVQDVSVDNAKVVTNAVIGNINGPITAGTRTTGYRGLSSASFTDGYVKALRVYIPQSVSGQVRAHVWVIKKGETKATDKYLRKIMQTVNVQTVGTSKYIDVPVNSKFEEEVFFMLRTEGTQIQGVNQIKQEFRDDAINVNDSFNPQSTTDNINWNGFNLQNDIIGHMELHGRIGIVDLAKKINQVENDGSQYVKVTDTTDGTGVGSHSGKVLKLGDDGKIKKEVLPAIALNEFITIDSQDFNENALTGHEYQNGDVIFNSRTQKRYLCIDSNNNTFANRFIELNDKTGVVTSINSETGDVNLSVVEDGDVVKIKVNQREIGTINAITQQEITEILDTLS